MRLLALSLLLAPLLAAQALAVPIPFRAPFPGRQPTDTERAASFKESAYAFIDQLVQRGHFGIVCAIDQRTLTTSSVRREIAELDVKVVPVFLKPKDATRWSAFYEAGGKRVFLNRQSVDGLLLWPSLAFHEAIGLLSYPDDNYEITTAFGLYETIAETAGLASAARERLKALIDAYLVERLCTSYRREFRFTPSNSTAPNDVLIARGPGGGTDIIGGAGDAAAIGVKLDILTRYAFQYQSKHSLGMLRRLLDLRLELSPSGANELVFSCRPLEAYVPRHLVASADPAAKNALLAMQLEIIHRVEQCAASEGLTP